MSNTAKNIIEWYDTFDPHKNSIEDLSKARQRLAAYMVGMAEQIAHAEIITKVAYHERKIAEAEAFLSVDGTVAERQAKAINAKQRIDEARAEGELSGMKLLFESYSKVLDSMASQLRLMQKI